MKSSKLAIYKLTVLHNGVLLNQQSTHQKANYLVVLTIYSRYISFPETHTLLSVKK